MQRLPSPMGLSQEAEVFLSVSLSQVLARWQCTSAQSWGGTGRELWILVKG